MLVTSSVAWMGRRFPVDRTIQVLDGALRGVPTKKLLDAALHGPGTVVTHGASVRSTNPA